MIKRILLALSLTLIIVGSISAQEVVATLPEHLQPITPDNAAQLQEIARIGNGVFNRGIAYSPDGGTLAVGGSLGIWLYDANDLYAPPTLIDLDAPVYDVEFSHDGRYMVYGVSNGGDVHVMDFATREEVLRVEGLQFALHPDGNLLAVGFPFIEKDVTERFNQHAFVKLYDISSKSEVLTFNPSGSARRFWRSVTGLEFSPDGDRLVVSVADFPTDTCDDGYSASIVFERTENTWKRLTGFSSRGGIAFNHDGTLIASEENAELGLDQDYILMWDSETGEQHAALHNGAPNYGITYQSYGFSADGEYLIATGYNQILRWNVATGELLNAITVTDEPYYRDHTVARYHLHSFNYSPDGTHIVITTPVSVQIWDADLTSYTEIYLDGTSASAEVLPSGSLVSVRDSEQQARAWVVGESSVTEYTISTQGDDLYFSDDGAILARLTPNHQIQLWSLSGGELISTLAGEFPFRWYVQFSPDSSTIVTWQIEQLENNERRISLGLWDVAAGTLIQDLGTYPHAEEVVFSRDSQRIGIVYSDVPQGPDRRNYMSQIIDIQTGETVFESSHQGEDGDFSPNLNILAQDGSDWTNLALRVLDVQTSTELIPNSVFVPSLNGYLATFTPDETQFLIVAGSYTNCGGDFRAAYLWDIPRAQQIAQIYLQGATGGWTNETYAFNNSSNLLMIADSNRIRLWNSHTGEEVTSLWVGGRQAYFNPDDTLIVTTGSDGTIRLYGVLGDDE